MRLSGAEGSLHVVLTQCAIDELSHKRFAGFGGHAVTKSAIDERHLETFNAIVGDVGGEINVVDVKFAIGLGFGKDFAEEFHLVFIEVFPDLFDHPDVAKEGGTQVSVAHDCLLDHAQVGVDELDDLLLRPNLALGHLVHLVGEPLQLAFDNGVEHLFLVLKIGVDRAAPTSRCHGDIVHRGVFKALLGKQLAGYIHHLLSSLRY